MTKVSVGSHNTRAIASRKKGSFNREDRTFNAVFCTETPALMRGYIDGQYLSFNEILSCDPAHVRSERLIEGVAFLDDHNRWGINSQIGKVRNITIQEKEISAQVKLSRRKELDTLLDDIEDEIVTNLSIGYRVFKYEELTQKGDAVRTFKAIDWEMYEGTVTPVQVDPKASIRSEDNKNELVEVEILTRKMEDNQETPVVTTAGTPAPAAPTPTPAPAAVVETDNVRSIGAERQRSAEIMRLGRKAKFTDEQVETAISTGTSVESFRGLILDSLLEKDPGNPAGTETQQRANPVPKVTKDEAEKTRALMELGLDLKLGLTTDSEVTDRNDLVAAQQFRSMTALDMSRAMLIINGEDPRAAAFMGPDELSRRAIISSSTFDFPELLSGLVRRTLLKDYKIVADTWRNFCKIGTIPNFQEWKRLHGGSISNLDLVDENGEYKTKPLPDGKGEIVKIDTYGNIINITRKMMINDDLGAFYDKTKKLVRASSRTIESAFITLLEANPNMGDGNALFSAAHGNLITGPGIAFGGPSIKAMRALLEKQKDLSDNDFLDLELDRLLVPNNLFDDAILLNTSDFADEANKFQKKNIYKNAFGTVVKSPRLTSAIAHYAFTNPEEEPVFEMTFLDGKQTPYLEEKPEFIVDGIRWKIRHDWGVNAVGWKGAVKNVGL